MMVPKLFIFGLISLHLMTGCTGSNKTCKASMGHGWACPPSWYQWGRKCYIAIIKPLLTWSKAKDECIKMGGVLVAPRSQEETDFLIMLLPFWFWINCNDLEEEGNWKCQDGNDKVEFRNWVTDPQWLQPDNWGPTGEDCAVLRYRHGKKGDGMTRRAMFHVLRYAFNLYRSCVVRSTSDY